MTIRGIFKVTHANTTLGLMFFPGNEYPDLSMDLPNQGVTVKIKTPLHNYLKTNTTSLLVQLAAVVDSNSSWTDESLVNQLVSLNITRNGQNLNVLPYPVDIYFNYKSRYSKLTRGFISKTLPGNLLDNSDDLVAVYKLNALNRTGSVTILITFYGLKTNENFRVLLTRNIQPNYNSMISHSKIISKDNNLYKIEIQIQYEDNYFLGIILNTPETHLPSEQVEYTFQVKYVQCLLKHGDEWSVEGCNVGAETTEGRLHCRCRHLSLFGGHVGVPPRDLDLWADISLFLDIKEDPRTVLLVSSLILVYLIVLVWTRHSDRKDQLQRRVVVLADNLPGQSWPYLVTVFTGLWIGAGTEASVALRLYGTHGMSKVHVLESQERKVLKQNCDDWFLIFTPKSLGEITKIHLFHDHGGRSHDWYCSKILIYDLKGEQNYKFIIEKWLSLVEVDECVELYVYPVSTLKYLKRGRIIHDNIIFGLRETHLLLSIFTRHPRSSVTRSQRLSICLCIVIMHLLTSIMFYQVEEFSETPDYSPHRREIIISMESTFIATPFTFIVIFCFKKSRVALPKKGENIPMTLTAKMPVPLESGLKANQSNTTQKQWVTTSESGTSCSSTSVTLSSGEEGEEEEESDGREEVESCWKRFNEQLKNLLFKVLLVHPMMPVRIVEDDARSSSIRRAWIFAAWFLCLVAIFAGAIFIILYNLKMDIETSNNWMHASFRYSLANIFLMSPVKIVIFAVILALLYGQLQYIPSYECDTDAALNHHYLGNEKFLLKILEIRMRNCYRPLKNRENMAIRIVKANWRQWRIVINFIVVVLLYTVLTFEVLFHWDGLYVPTSHNIKKMFGEGRNISSLLSYYEYLSTLALPTLNKKYWYNGEPFKCHEIWKEEVGSTQDYVTRLMSRPFIRQQRAAQDSCRVMPIMSSRFSRCYAPLAEFSVGEHGLFSVNWSQPHEHAGDNNDHAGDNDDHARDNDDHARDNEGHARDSNGHTGDNDDNIWQFSDSDSPLLICGVKTGKCYVPGGYVSRLQYNITTDDSILRSLQQAEWLDGPTRVVFLELLMYNANTDLMSYAAPMLEKLADGSFHFHVKNTNLHSRPINYGARLVIFLSFTFYYFCRTVLLFNRQGLAYIFSTIGLLDIFLNILLYITMISMTLYNASRAAYINNWRESHQEDLIMTTDIFVHRAVLRYETAILVVIIPAQLVHNFHVGKRILIVSKTLTTYFKMIIGLGLVWMVCFIALKEICTINGRNREIFSLDHLFGWMSSDSFSNALHFVTNVISIFTVTLSAICYGKANYCLKYHCNFNIFCFICKKLKRAKIKSVEFKKRLRKRRRAGADGIELLSVNRTCYQVEQMCSDLAFKCELVLGKLSEIEVTL